MFDSRLEQFVADLIKEIKAESLKLSQTAQADRGAAGLIDASTICALAKLAECMNRVISK